MVFEDETVNRMMLDKMPPPKKKSPKVLNKFKIKILYHKGILTIWNISALSISICLGWLTN